MVLNPACECPCMCTVATASQHHLRPAQLCRDDDLMLTQQQLCACPPLCSAIIIVNTTSISSMYGQQLQLQQQQHRRQHGGLLDTGVISSCSSWGIKVKGARDAAGESFSSKRRTVLTQHCLGGRCVHVVCKARTWHWIAGVAHSAMREQFRIYNMINIVLMARVSMSALTNRVGCSQMHLAMP